MLYHRIKKTKQLNEEELADLNYFTNTIFINQEGEEMKFFEDLLFGNIVLINAFYSESVSTVPRMHASMNELQEHFK